MLPKGTLVNGKYSVQFLIKGEFRSEPFRVKDNRNKNLFLKLINLAALKSHEFSEEGLPHEFRILQSIDHSKIPHLIDKGEYVYGHKRYSYIVLEFVSGESLADHLKRSLTLDNYDAINIAIDLLEALDYLHNLPDPVMHCNILPENIVLDLSGGVCTAKLCGFGSARNISQPREAFQLNLSNPFYTSHEGINKVFTPQNDVYSVGALLYQLLYGLPPWYVDIRDIKGVKAIKDAVLQERVRPLKGLSLLNVGPGISDSLYAIIEKALSFDVSVRYEDARSFIVALKNELKFVGREVSEQPKAAKIADQLDNDFTQRGLAGVAGMQPIKDILVNDVLNILNDKEGAKEYGISIPNGMLLYGPPGCGKTYIAQKFAEEANYNFLFVKPSDMASIYIHGSQEKIGKLFAEARDKKPSILCFDEFDSFVPRRDVINNSSMSGEVNEFLTQLNNCGKTGVFVIGTTNRPDLIDIDVLRKGRFDIILYVPPPDYEARLGLFKVYLESKPVDFGIDFQELANLTEGRVCSDIEYIVSEVARMAYRQKNRIRQEDLIEVISKSKSSLSEEHKVRYQSLREQIESSTPPPKKHIGFEL